MGDDLNPNCLFISYFSTVIPKAPPSSLKKSLSIFALVTPGPKDSATLYKALPVPGVKASPILIVASPR